MQVQAPVAPILVPLRQRYPRYNHCKYLKVIESSVKQEHDHTYHQSKDDGKPDRQTPI